MKKNRLWRRLAVLVQAWMALQFLTSAAPAPPKRTSVLSIHPVTPHYFQAPDGKPAVLIGDYTWGTFSDVDFDFEAQFDALQTNGLNFARVWLWWGCEQFPPPDDHRHVEPFLRPGPGQANDGRPKYDLGRFNAAFFQRLRDLCAAARRRGLFLQLITVDAWMLKHPHLWKLHAFHRDNNINGVDGDPRNTGKGTDGEQGFCSMKNPKALEFQKAYLRKLAETVSGFDNVLIEIANENYYGAEWERHLCEFIREQERGGRRQHLLMPLDLPSHSSVVQKWDPKTIHAALLEKRSLRQPLIFDTDWIINQNDAQVRRAMWTAVLSGGHFNYMDDSLPFRLAAPSSKPVPDQRANLHRQIGYMALFVKRLKPWTMQPSDAWVKSGQAFALASTNELAAYLPAGGRVTLDLIRIRGRCNAAWFNPRAGGFSESVKVDGGALREFTAPDGHDWALLLKP
ncbi:MAG: hypothetical protein HY674_17180 [Chloroflexi bacterium]|nr:hypothetical protein [Chloroflexota bacterium]